ncbi:hypothetical protein D3C73_967500 [compost metagenome]
MAKFDNNVDEGMQNRCKLTNLRLELFRRTTEQLFTYFAYLLLGSIAKLLHLLLQLFIYIITFTRLQFPKIGCLKSVKHTFPRPLRRIRQTGYD